MELFKLLEIKTILLNNIQRKIKTFGTRAECGYVFMKMEPRKPGDFAIIDLAGDGTMFGIMLCVGGPKEMNILSCTIKELEQLKEQILITLN